MTKFLIFEQSDFFFNLYYCNRQSGDKEEWFGGSRGGHTSFCIILCVNIKGEKRQLYVNVAPSKFYPGLPCSVLGRLDSVCFLDKGVLWFGASGTQGWILCKEFCLPITTTSVAILCLFTSNKVCRTYKLLVSDLYCSMHHRRELLSNSFTVVLVLYALTNLKELIVWSR